MGKEREQNPWVVELASHLIYQISDTSTMLQMRDTVLAAPLESHKRFFKLRDTLKVLSISKHEELILSAVQRQPGAKTLRLSPIEYYGIYDLPMWLIYRLRGCDPNYELERATLASAYSEWLSAKLFEREISVEEFGITSIDIDSGKFECENDFRLGRIVAYEKFVLNKPRPNSQNKTNYLYENPARTSEREEHSFSVDNLPELDAWYYEMCSGTSFVSEVAAIITGLHQTNLNLPHPHTNWPDFMIPTFCDIFSGNRDLLTECPLVFWRIAVLRDILPKINDQLNNLVEHSTEIFNGRALENMSDSEIWYRIANHYFLSMILEAIAPLKLQTDYSLNLPKFIERHSIANGGKSTCMPDSVEIELDNRIGFRMKSYIMELYNDFPDDPMHIQSEFNGKYGNLTFYKTLEADMNVSFVKRGKGVLRYCNLNTSNMSYATKRIDELNVSPKKRRNENQYNKIFENVHFALYPAGYKAYEPEFDETLFQMIMRRTKEKGISQDDFPINRTTIENYADISRPPKDDTAT